MLLLLGNVLCAIGALFSFYATYKLGFAEDKQEVFKFSSVSCAFLLVGSAMLASWPAVALDVVWLFLSILGYKDKPMPKCFIIMKKALWVFFVAGVAAMLVGEFSLAAIMCACIYVVAYSSFAGGFMSRSGYIIWCLLGYVLFVPHLYEVQSYSVLGMETISFILAVIGWFKLSSNKEHAVE